MNKFLLYIGATLILLISIYAALAALVNQGLSIWGALVMLVLVVGGGIGLILAVKN